MWKEKVPFAVKSVRENETLLLIVRKKKVVGTVADPLGLEGLEPRGGLRPRRNHDTKRGGGRILRDLIWFWSDTGLAIHTVPQKLRMSTYKRAKDGWVGENKCRTSTATSERFGGHGAW